LGTWSVFFREKYKQVICLIYHVSLAKCGIKMWRVRKGGYEAGPLHLFDT